MYYQVHRPQYGGLRASRQDLFLKVIETRGFILGKSQCSKKSKTSHGFS